MNRPADGQRILGIDPGLKVTGYGVVQRVGPQQVRLVEAGVIRPPAGASLEERLGEIFDGVCDVIQSLRPESLSLEKFYSHYQRPQTAILMGHARGVVCLAAQRNGLKVYHYPPTNIKRLLTGSGRAPKEQMQQAIQRELGLRRLPEPHDVADALAVALCHCYTRRQESPIP